MMGITHIFLQHYWWIIISVLAGLLVFLLFVQGGQSLIFTLPRNEMQKVMIINALGRKWEFTFTTLVTFGGAFFAAFPLFYATSFGGAYWVWIAILFSFIIQAVAYEYRAKPGNVLGTRTYEIFLLINGSAGPLLLGTAVATFFTGANFRLGLMNQAEWTTGWHGLEAVLDGRNLALGIAVLFLARCNGILFIIRSVKDDELTRNAVRSLTINAVVFLVFFLFFVISILLSKGYALDKAGGEVYLQAFKYFSNLVAMPFVLILFLAGVVLVLAGLFTGLFREPSKAIWFTGTGTIITVIALFLLAGFNNTPFYPSIPEPQSSLTIFNASSSLFTLRTMMYVSFIIPLVGAYIWLAWRAISRKQITPGEMDSEDHKY